MNKKFATIIKEIDLGFTRIEGEITYCPKSDCLILKSYKFAKGEQDISSILGHQDLGYFEDLIYDSINLDNDNILDEIVRATYCKRRIKDKQSVA